MTARTRHEILRLIASDCESDTRELEGQLLTGRLVAEEFGKTRAMIAALSGIVETLLFQEDDDGS